MLLPVELNDGVLGERLFHDTQDDTLFAMTPAGGSRFFEIGTTGNIGIFDFASSDSTGRPTLEISWNGIHAETLERVPDSALWKPTASALSEYVGTWFSSDLDTGWKLAIQGQSLVIVRPAQPRLSLWPVSPDQFVRGFGSWVNSTLVKVQFHRNDARQLTHFTVSTPGGDNAAQEIRFDRVVQ